MSPLTLFGAIAVTVMLLAYALEHHAVAWVFVFALACAASSLYGWLAGTWPFGVVEGVWALVAARRGLLRLKDERQSSTSA
jgi:hypothetical protein